MADQIDPYKILQVDPEAEDEVIQAAYRRLARKYHPDLSKTADAAARMSAINSAWERIGDPVARKAYDLERAETARAGTPAAPTPAPPSPASARPAHRPTSAPNPQPTRPPETVSRDWTSGRSTRSKCRPPT